MTIDVHIRGCIYSNGPELAGRCGHMGDQMSRADPWEGLCYCRTVFQELLSQEGLRRQSKRPLTRKILETGAQTTLLNVFMEAKGIAITKAGSHRSKCGAPISKVKISGKTFLVFGGYKRNILTESSNLEAASHPGRPHPTNHHPLPLFNLTLKTDSLHWDVNLRGFFSVGM